MASREDLDFIMVGVNNSFVIVNRAFVLILYGLS